MAFSWGFFESHSLPEGVIFRSLPFPSMKDSEASLENSFELFSTECLLGSIRIFDISSINPKSEGWSLFAEAGLRGVQMVSAWNLSQFFHSSSGTTLSSNPFSVSTKMQKQAK